MSSFLDTLKFATRHISDNSPAILTAMGALGVVSTAVLAARGAIAADRVLDEHREGVYGIDRTKYMSFSEKLQLTWKFYLPAALAGGTTIACIVGANSINAKRNAALMGLYSLTDRTLTEYREKVFERLGEAKERVIQDDVARDRIDNNPISKKGLHKTEYGTHLCFDSVSDRYFTGDVERIRQVVEAFNEELRTKVAYVTLNQFYEAIGIPPTLIGSTVGWDNERLLKFTYTSTLDEWQRPVLSLNYRVAPVRPLTS